MQAMMSYHAGTVKKEGKQYTIRNVPERLDQCLRESAARYGTSLNEAALAALSHGAGLEGEPIMHHDLDDLAGTWVPDEAFDKAVADMDSVDTELWK